MIIIHVFAKITRPEYQQIQNAIVWSNLYKCYGFFHLNYRTKYQTEDMGKTLIPHKLLFLVNDDLISFFIIV